MKHYSRENQRAQDQIADLAMRRNVLETNVAAINACWEQVIYSLQKALTISTEIISAYPRSQFIGQTRYSPRT